MIDILSSHDGRIDSPKDPADATQWTSNQQIPLMYSNGDVLFANAFPRPRLGQGGFRAAFESTFRAATGHDVYSTTFGKPTRVTYDFALDRLKAQAKELDLDLANMCVCSRSIADWPVLMHAAQLYGPFARSSYRSALSPPADRRQPR
jgi:ribonucleotide monophosphatase NagD (HAD superfamily)